MLEDIVKAGSLLLLGSILRLQPISCVVVALFLNLWSLAPGTRRQFIPHMLRLRWALTLA
ncbi:unnamed protein product [Protopolystoma xenopodis]|uniref:Uncharacterized protein n=1 Tax=Protopolystoma xenopodis TaxID=117903 RepID=A0A448X6L4_9PLAT|nr:unnamed protein product [Protopolystoma xenopodis]